MSYFRWPFGIVLALLALASPLACSSGTSVLETGSKEGSETSTEGGSTSPRPSGPFKLGDLIEEPFTPPPLDELIESKEWIDNEVADSLELLRERQADEPVPGTVAEALERRNNSSEDNRFILSVLGRLPESPEDVDWQAGIRRHAAADVKSLNPLFASSTIEFDVVGLTGIGLVGFDWNFNTFASVDTVVSWQSSADGLVDKFVLRDDLYWSDGEPVTAHDFAFTYQVIMSSQVPVVSRTAESQLKWVEAYDDQTLVIFHKQPLATNRWNCSLSVIPKHIYESSIEEDPTLQNSVYNVKYEQNPVVAGPYQVVRRVQGQEIELLAREAYYTVDGEKVRTEPYFQAITFRTITDSNTALLALKSGAIEEMQLDANQWRSQTNGNDFYRENTRVRATEWTSFHFCWNIGTPYFSDERVRWAMTYAFDREEMLSSIFFNLYEPCQGVFHPDSQWAPPNTPPVVTRDLDKAEELLEEAGWYDHDGDGTIDKEINGRYVPFEFTILTSNRPERIAVCRLLEQNLAEIGITCHVNPMEFTVLQQKTFDHDFQACMGGWGTGADPFTLQNIFGSDEDRNFGQYSNERVDELFEQGLKELDPEARAKIYQEIHTELWNDQPYTWLFTQAAFYGFNKSLRGYVFSPRGPYNYGPGFSSIWKPREQ